MEQRNRHPIDSELRARLRGANQSDVARKAGVERSWLNKYVHGDGKATIDDVLRLAAVLLGVTSEPLTVDEQKILKACQGLSDEDRQDVLAYAEHRGRLARRGASKESSEPAAQTPPGKAGKGRGR